MCRLYFIELAAVLVQRLAFCSVDYKSSFLSISKIILQIYNVIGLRFNLRHATHVKLQVFLKPVCSCDLFKAINYTLFIYVSVQAPS